MSHELFYTSAARGLRPGNNGYCTVAATQGLPALLGQKLEALSDYRPLFDGSAAEANRNPVALSHLRLNVLGKTYSVLSRICPAGVDHTHRGIFFAHHVALEPGELVPAGPAWLLGKPGFLETHWDGQVRELPAGRQPPMGTSVAGVCQAWKKVTGDPGWAGVLVESYLENPNRPVYLLYPLGLDPLPLLAEALALLPPEPRWRVTFSTLCVSVPQDTVCSWRCLPLETAEARKARMAPGALVLDLGSALAPALGGVMVAAARTGKLPLITPAPLPSPVSPGLLTSPAPPAGSWMSTPKPSLPLPSEDKGKPDLDPPPRREPEPMLPEPAAPRGGSFLPFALGLLVGVALTGAGTAAAWHLVKPESDRELQAERQKQENELQTAKQTYEKELQAARRLARERGDALARAEEDKQQAIKDARRGLFTRAELEKAEKEAAAAALKGQPKSEEARTLKDELEKETKARQKVQAALKAREEVLDLLADKLFIKSRPGKNLKSNLVDMRQGKSVEGETWEKDLQEWLSAEVGAFFFRNRRAFNRQELGKMLENKDKAIEEDYWRDHKQAIWFYAEEELKSLADRDKVVIFPLPVHYTRDYHSLKRLFNELDRHADTALSVALVEEFKKRLDRLTKPKTAKSPFNP